MARLYGYALSLTGDRELSQDLLQDCAVRVLSAKTAPSEAAALRAWFFRILRNLWIDGFRRSRLEPASDEPAPPAQENWRFDEQMIDVITVRHGIGRLPPAYRDVIALVDLVGFPYAEVADILGVPIGTVMSRLSRARQALLTAIGETNVHPLRAKQGS
jgi:RNA polymerase sigma-70 factor, ECF subfamily